MGLERGPLRKGTLAVKAKLAAIGWLRLVAVAAGCSRVQLSSDAKLPFGVDSGKGQSGDESPQSKVCQERCLNRLMPAHRLVKIEFCATADSGECFLDLLKGLRHRATAAGANGFLPEHIVVRLSGQSVLGLTLS